MEWGRKLPEDQAERLNRNLDQLVSELRVALPGVQVLFAFLLTVPFNQRFSATSPFQRGVYLVTLLCAALSSCFLIAPSVHHRVLFHQKDKPHMVRLANSLAITGMAFLLAAITGSVLLVSWFLFGLAAGMVISALVALVFAWYWFGHPLWRRTRTSG